MKRTIGIDLGTTNCAVATLDEYCKPVVVKNGEGESITPSVICFKDGEIIIGSEAKALQEAGEPDVAVFFKRSMGDPHFTFFANGMDHNAAHLSFLLLAHIKELVEAELGETVEDAVITVPAYFKNPHREATKEAGRRAGFNVLQIINEPTAAAIAYGMNKSPGDQTLLVYDLGGGTFDVTVLKTSGDELRILTSTGDHELGGKNWDDWIVDYLADRFKIEHGVDPLEDSVSVADILARVESAKKSLSARTTTKVSLIHDGMRGSYDLDRETFEEGTSDLLERTAVLCRQVIDELEMSKADIDGVLLVGGSTRMPMVKAYVEREFGKPPLSGVNVDEAVALGAAIVAAEHVAEKSGGAKTFSLPGLRAVDVTNHSLGMIATNPDNSAYINTRILPKNKPVPCQEDRPYTMRTRKTGNNPMEVFLTQGESQSPGDVTYLGLYYIDSVPYTQRGTTVVDVDYAYDVSGTVNVTARARDTGQLLPITIKPLPDDVPARFMRPPEPEAVAEHVTAYLAFDLSGSMSGHPLAEAKKAAKGFLRNMDLSHCSVGVIAVADQTKTKLEACQDAVKIEHAIDGLAIREVGIGNSADPFDEILRLLSNAESPKFAIVLADGVWYQQEVAVRRARQCHQAEIEIVAIGFGEADEKFLRDIASSDEASFMTSLEGLTETFSTIAQAISETGGHVKMSSGGDEKSLKSWFLRK